MGVEVVRYNFRLRAGSSAERALLDEWHRCRFLWNEAVHLQKTGARPTSGKLSKQLTETRRRSAWLRAGSQVAQQQTLRTYARALDSSFAVKGRNRPKFKSRKQRRRLSSTPVAASGSRKADCACRRASQFRWCGRGNCHPDRRVCASPATRPEIGTRRSSSPAAPNLRLRRRLVRRSVSIGE